MQWESEETRRQKGQHKVEIKKEKKMSVACQIIEDG